MRAMLEPPAVKAACRCGRRRIKIVVKAQPAKR